MELSGLGALNVALKEVMALDEKVVCVGEDIGAKGGAWGYFSGLYQQYGRERVIQTPICEYGYTGLANGMAYGGYRPVVEYMFADFCALAFDPIVNQAAKARYNSNGNCNLAITYMLPEGGGGRSGSQHSQSVEAWFANIPGLKIVAPTSPADLRYFLKAAVTDDDPVVFIFSRACAMGMKEDVNTEDRSIPSLKNAAKIVKEGADLTVIAWHRPLNNVIAVTKEIERETGKTIEIIDPRVFCPFDLDTVVRSVKKTKKALIAHEAPERGGFGTLISAWISENCFAELAAPVRRIGGYNTCIPFGQVEEYAFPQTDDLKAGMRSLL
ncbi:MAG: alpha-ketoacid dehydrogenase subunit beta [Clostridiales Family XIII bacterium]|jgi:pyruvate dehydrogenase E1 component beta subunit|nr:alpha-ketoacid dehydrogenase subunit beta [Clostridiales Family XIII bacterium]